MGNEINVVGEADTPSIESPTKGKTVTKEYADVTLRLIEEHGDSVEPLSPEQEKRVRRKLYLRLVGLLSTINIMLFIDKSTLGYAAILGLFEETGISQAQYNNLNTMFYVGYLSFLWPGHYLMQRLPFSKFIAGIIFTWSVVIFLHCVATRYAGLIVLRLALGAAEGVVVPALEMTIGMFFNRAEQSFLQPILWITCQGAPIVTGFIAYGLLWTSGPVLPWKLLHVVTGGITFILSIWVWFDYPSNPAEARFLTLQEKVHIIKRVQQSQQSSIEQKQFKRSQFVETLKDPVSWLFALQAFTLMYCNNLTYGQKNLLVTSLGVSPLESTLVAVAGGGFGIINCVIAAFALRRYPKNFALHCTLWCLPAVAGGIGMVTVPWDRTIGLLACMFLAAHTYGVAYIIALGWTNSSAAGYTKKLTRNVMFMIGYSAGNLVSPQIWVASAKPRFYGAWSSMIVVSWFGTPVILWVIHFILARRNKIRKQRIDAVGENAGYHYVEQLDESGQLVKVKVEVAMLDLTDLENEGFIYPFENHILLPGQRDANKQSVGRPNGLLQQPAVISWLTKEDSLDDRHALLSNVPHFIKMLEHLTPWWPDVQVTDQIKIDDLCITFKRTIRVPDNRDSNNLPPDCGNFPLYKVDEYATKLPLNMAQKGGLFLPMYQKEALWISFASKNRYAIKIFVGGINAISGEPAIPNAATTLRRRNRTRNYKSIQDYLAIGVNGQPWLDGVAVEPGKVRQFVAMPMGSGHSVEAQMTGEETTAGIQFEVTRLDIKELLENNVEELSEPDFDELLKAGCPSGTVVMRLIALSGDVTWLRAKLSTTIRALKLIYEHKKGVRLEYQILRCEGKRLVPEDRTLADYNIANLSDVYIDCDVRLGFNPDLAPAPEMNIAAGGLIDQGIVHIPQYDYLKTVPITFNVQILNSVSFKHVTGKNPPESTISAKTYADAGYPFFSLYEEPTTISGDFEGLKSVAQMDKVTEESMPADMPVVRIGAVGLLNPRGSKQELELEWEVRKRLGEMLTVL